MAALVIRIQEYRQGIDEKHKSVGFSILSGYEGELEAGDCLPGLEPLLLRTIREAIDSVFGGPIAVSEESIQDAQRQANRYKN